MLSRNCLGAKEQELFLYACQNGHTTLARSLLDANAHLAQTTGLEGRTGLQLAALMGNLTEVKMLVDAGADPRKTDDWGYNALLLAIPGGHSKIVSFLFNKCDLTCETPLGQTNPITEAAIHGHLSIANIILELYSRNFLNAPVSLSGMTPLMLAVASGDAATVKTLIKRHADTRMKNSSGMTASDLACYSENDAIKDLLGVNSRCAPLSPSFFTYQIQHPSELEPAPVDRIESFKNFKHLMVQIQDPAKSGVSLKNQHSLTPNVREAKRRAKGFEISKENKTPRGLSWLRIMKIRSRSASPRKPKKSAEENSSDGIFEFILSTAGLLNLWEFFEDHEIDLKVFLTLTDSDLDSIGITSKQEKFEILQLIDRYKNVF